MSCLPPDASAPSGITILPGAPGQQVWYPVGVACCTNREAICVPSVDASTRVGRYEHAPRHPSAHGPLWGRPGEARGRADLDLPRAPKHGLLGEGSCQCGHDILSTHLVHAPDNVCLPTCLIPARRPAGRALRCWQVFCRSSIKQKTLRRLGRYGDTGVVCLPSYDQEHRSCVRAATSSVMTSYASGTGMRGWKTDHLYPCTETG